MLLSDWHNEIQHSAWFAVYLRKTLYFLVFHRNVGLKTSTYEFTDRIHQNKQGFEGKKLSGKEYSSHLKSIRVCVVDNGSAILTVFLPGFSRLSCLLSSRILQNNLLDLYLVKMRRYKLSRSFFANSATNWNASRISSFSKKSLRYGNNRPGTGTSHIIGQNVGQIWSLNLE